MQTMLFSLSTNTTLHSTQYLINSLKHHSELEVNKQRNNFPPFPSSSSKNTHPLSFDHPGAPAHFIVKLLVSKLRTVVQMTPQEKITANEIIEKSTKKAVNATFNAYISKQLAISHYGIALIAVVSFGAASPSRFFSSPK
jgi:hypothetical protein